VIFPLMSSRGNPSSPPEPTDEDESDVLAVLLVTAADALSMDSSLILCQGHLAVHALH